MEEIFNDNNTIKLSKIELELIDKDKEFELIVKGKTNFIYRYNPNDTIIPVQEFNGNYYILFNPEYEKVIEVVNKIKEITNYNKK